MAGNEDVLREKLSTYKGWGAGRPERSKEGDGKEERGDAPASLLGVRGTSG